MYLNTRTTILQWRSNKGAIVEQKSPVTGQTGSNREAIKGWRSFMYQLFIKQQQHGRGSKGAIITHETHVTTKREQEKDQKRSNNSCPLLCI
jgi:hypothetical protein